MEQDLWYRWRELDRTQQARHLFAPPGRANPGVIEQTRRGIGHALIRAGVAVAGLSVTPARSAVQ